MNMRTIDESPILLRQLSLSTAFYLVVTNSFLLGMNIVYLVDQHPCLLAEQKKETDKIYGCILDGFYEGPNIWWQLADRLNESGYIVRHVMTVKDVKPGFSCIVTTNMRLDEMQYVVDHKEFFEPSKLIFMMWEPPSVNPYNYYYKLHQFFGKILTWCDDIVDNKKYVKLFYPRQQLCMVHDIVPFSKKKLCCMIASFLESTYPGELYTERLDTIEYFEKHEPNAFDLYGSRGWVEKKLKNYKGSISKKIEILKKYRFCICYENAKDINGYITEKIFDCFHACCVPVYWGANNVEQYIPQSCFIDRRRFVNNAELYAFLKNMSEAEYAAYLEAIEDYLSFDPRAQLFSVENFITNVCQVILAIAPIES